MCRWNLVEVFPRFLRAHPVQAFEACLVAVEGTTRYEHINHPEHQLSSGEPFSFRGLPAAILQDYSHIWDDRSYPNDELRLLQNADGYLEGIDVASQGDLLNKILNVFAQKARVAVLWKHLLEVGVRRPDSLGIQLADLCLARPVFLCPDTTYEVGELIRKLSETLDATKIQAIERTILDIPDDPVEKESYPRHIKNRLMSVLGNKAQTDEGKALLASLAATNETVSNRPLHVRGEVTSRLVTNEMWLGRQGVDLSEPNNSLLHRPIDALEKLNRGDNPPDEGKFVEALLAATRVP